MTIRFDVKETSPSLKDGFRIIPALVTYQLDGKQKRRSFTCKKAGKRFYDNVKAQTSNLGKAFWALKPADADLACRALERSHNNGYDLMTALAFYEAQTKLSGNAMIDHVVDKIVALKMAEPLSKKYKENCERDMHRFAKAHSGWLLDTFKPSDIENYVNDEEKGWGIVTREYNKRLISVFFNMCKKLKYTIKNPVEFLPKKQRAKVAANRYIDFINPDEARIILRIAEKKRPQYVVPLVLTMFNGLRMDTSTRMHPRDISPEHSRINVPHCIDKSYGRAIDMMPNTKAWLEKYLPISILPVLRLSNNGFIPEVLASQDHEKFEDWKYDCRHAWATVRAFVCRHLKLKENEGGRWPKNGLRHAFCTHYLALTGDLQKTAYMAGNTPEMIQKDYDGKLFKKEQAEEYFNIFPE